MNTGNTENLHYFKNNKKLFTATKVVRPLQIFLGNNFKSLRNSWEISQLENNTETWVQVLCSGHNTVILLYYDT